jgi:gliding motility-associated-like protein
LLAATAVITSPIGCHGGQAVVSVTASGGTASYTGIGNFNVSAGTYTYPISDTNGCSAQAVITITEPTPINVSATLTNPISCNGGQGQVTVSANGGTPSYASGIGIFPVTAGPNQVFTVVDTNGCTGSDTITITQPTMLSASVVQNNPILCHGDTTTVTVTASGGTPNYSGIGVFPVTVGTHTFVVTDANGCEDSVTITITQPNALSVSATPQQITCFGLNNGSISPAVSGGTPGYTFVWSGTDFSGNPISFGDNTLQNQFGLGAGSYSVQVTDFNGCILNSVSWSITNPLTSPSIQNINVQNVNCFGNNTGSISFLATGGTPDYDVNLDGILQGNIPTSGGTLTITSLTAGTYILEIIDNNGCVDTEPITITQPNSAVVAVVDSVNNVSCNGLSDGDIFATISGGTAPYSYFWSVVGGVGGPIPAGEIASEDPQGLPDGNYQLLVMDALGCTTTVITQVTEPTPINIVWQDSGPLCDGNSLGFINLQLSGGTPNANSPLYNTSWVWAPLQNPGINCSATNIPNNTFSPSSLTCGIYTVTVTDANGCTAQYTDSIIITPTPFQANFTSTNIQCFGQTDGTITVTPTTGTAPFDVVITPSGGVAINPPGAEIFAVNNSYSANNLPPDAYLVTITDNNGCQDDTTITITAPQSPIVASILSPVDVSCFGDNDGSFIVGINGGTAPYTINVDPVGVAPPFSTNLNQVSNLSANSYSVTVLDVNQCPSAAVTAIINQPAALQATITGSTINCFGDCSAGISSAVSGGTVPYTYQWTSGANSWNTPNINNLCAGSYQFSLVDNNGCTFADSYTINQPASPMVVTIVDTDSLSCFGANDGQIVVAVNGGTPNYTVSLGANSQNINPNINNTATFSNLGAGNYVLVVTDNNGCDTNINISISSPPALTLNVVPTNILCAGDSTGILNLTVNGGVPNLSFVITGPSPSTGGINGSTFVDSLPAGVYTITVTDNNGCTSTVSSTISVPSPLQITDSITNVLCQGLSTGQITTAVSGGAGGYIYSWVASNGGILTSGASAASQINIPAGTYTLTVTDANNCSYQEIYTVTQPQLPLSSVISNVTNVTCGNQNNGQITVAISGGTPNYNINGIGATVVVNPAVGNTHQFSNLPGGNYALTVTDANGCSVNLTQNITQPNPLTLGITSTNVLCFGASTGALEFTTSGGTAPINYTVVGPPNSSGTIPTTSLTITQVGTPAAGILPAGNYTVNIIDANGCTDTISTTITQPQPIVIQGTVTPILCFGQGAGAISTTTSGGVPPFTYLWSNSNPTPNITGVPAGPYTLTVTDANLCTSTQTWSVVQPPLALSINLSALTNISCSGANDGSIQVTASGGTAGYQVSYQRTNPPGPLVSPAGVEIPLSGGSYPVGGLSAGNYTLTVVDANGCSIQDTFTIIEPPAFGATVSANTILCNPGNTGVLTITTPPGSYPVTYVINGPGGSYSGNINTSPFYYPNQLGIPGLSGGSYTIDLTYNNGLCTQQLSATINQPANPISVTPTVTDVPCAGVNSGSICLNVTGGTGPYSYAWSIPGNTSCQNNLAPGTYNVTVTDANNCPVPNTYTISGPVSPLVADSSFTNVLCLGQNDGTITITTNGGSPSYTLTSATLLPASTTINLTGGTYQYTNVPAGMHTVLITDANGCTDSETITITQPQNPLNVVNLTATDVQCYGDMNGSIAFNVTGGTAPYTVVWSAVGLPAVCSVPASTVTNSGIISATGLCQGSYSVNITDLNGCPYSFAQSIIAPNLPLTASATQTNILCHGQCTGVATTVPSGGTAPYQHSWSNGQTTPSITGLCIGDYYDTITDANGCEIIVQFSITAPAQPMVVTITDVDVDCFDNATGSITVSATGGTPGYNVSWTPGPPFPGAGLEILNSGDVYSIPGLLAGNYTVYVQDLNNCLDSQVVLISQPPALTYTVTSSNVTCNGASNGLINVTVNGGVLPYTYLWNSTAGPPCSIPINQVNATGLCPGIYDVLVTDANGCQINTGATITEPDLLVISVVNDTVYCLPGTGTVQAAISGGTPNYTVNWQNVSGTIIGSGLSLGNLAPGVYNAVVVDANGCQNTAPFNIIGPAAPLTAAISHTNETCINNNDGTITIIPSGGTAPFVITGSPWNGSPNVAVSGGNAVSNNMVAGTYIYTITDAYLCQTTVSTTITQPTYLQVALQVTNVTCHNYNDGIIQITPSGSVPNYTVTWISGPNSGPCALPVTSIISGATSFNNLCPGVYVFSVTDANGCDTTLSATISEPQPLVLTPTSNDDPCNDANCQGSAGVSVTGGTAPYTYLWTGGASTSSVGQLCVGVYSVTVTDANGCDQSASVTINQPAQALSAIVTTTNETCNGSGDGTLIVTPNGGTAPYTIVGVTTPWGGPANINFAGGTSTWTGVSAGTYQVEITDANGCQISVSGTVTEPTPLAVALTPVDVTCFGANNGYVELGITGATPSYTINWINGPNNGACILPLNQNILAGPSPNYTSSGLCPGVYDVVIADANGCDDTLSFTINEPPAIILTVDSVAVLCHGDSSGQASVLAIGGTPGYTYNWTNLIGNFVIPFPTNDTIGSPAHPNGIPTGTYQVTVTDANGCTQVETVNINQPATPLLALVDHTDELCFPVPNQASTGTITIGANGGTGPYTIAGAPNNLVWTGPSTIVAQSMLPPNPISGQTMTGVASNLASAPYVFTVTDFHGCTSTVSVTVGSPAALSVITTPTNILCNGNNDGAINVAPSGGVSPYNINWISGPTGPGCVLPVTLTTNNNVSTPPSLCPGTYVMDIVDANGCVLSTSETILEPANPVNINYSVNDVLCYGDSSGQISTQVSGGTGPYTYNWTTLSTWNGLPYGIPFPTAANQPPGNPNHPFGLPAGTYMVTVNDANGNSGGCHDEVIITITQPATPVAGTLTPHAVDCNSNATGSIDITASGGVGPYIVTRNNNLIGTILLPGGTITETGLIAGNYTYVITDANWCAITVTTIVSQPAPLVVSLNNVVDVSCIPGSFDGQIDLSVVGGNSYYSYNWTTAALPPFPLPLTTPVGGPSVSNLYPGIYTVTVTDLLGCQSTLQVTVNQFPGFTVTSTIGDIQCHGNNTGSINLTLNGGTPNFTFQWTGPNGYTSIFQNIIGLGVGQYNVIVTDGAGCVVPLVATISEPSSALTSTVVSSNVACYGDNSGSISISATGGTPFAGPNPYNYEWYLNGLLFSTAQSLTNLFPGIYVCHITDANGCLLTEQVVITQPATALTYSINTTDVTCFGGSNGAIDITVSGGTGAPYSLLWNTGETTEDLANLAAGTYTLTITDAGPCVVTTAPITIIQPTPIVITPSILNVGCHGDASGMITTQVSGGTVSISAGYTYLWSTVNGVIPAGQSTLPNIGSTTHPFGLTPGDYNLLVTDANGCTSSLVATVIQPLAPLYIASTYTNVDCFGDSSGSISVYAEGGTLPYNVSWSGTVAGDPFGLEILSNPGTYIISSLPAGTYNFQVVDQNGCSLAGGAVITQNSLIDTVNTAIDSVFCANSSDGFISVSITGGIPNVLGAPYNISWSGVDASGNAIPMLFTTVAGNTTTASNLVAGTYTLTVTDAINCTRTFTYVMTEVAVSLSNVVDNDILCKGQCTGEIEFIPTGGDATYTVTVFPIGQPAANTITITEQDLQGSATGIFSLGGLCPGQYYVLITDANNCSANTPAITITEPSTVFSPSVNVISNSGCNDNAGILNVQVMGGTPGYNVAWHNITDPNIVSPAGIEINQSPGNYLIIGLSSGFIEVLVTDNVGCEIVDTVEIDDTDVTFANFTALDSAGCGPFLAQFTNLSLGENLSYFWSFGNGQTSTEENPSVTFDVGGPYDVTLTVTNAFGCTSTMVESGYIVSYASPNAAFTISSTGVDYYSGLVEFINNSVNAQFYTWDFGHFSNGSTEVNPTYYYPQWTEGDYIVTLVATDTNGCSDQTQLLISSSETVRLNVPNTVTIDDNGLNELFFPVFSNFEEILNFKLEIFDRWGELIFETKDIQGGWDGTYRGVDVQSGTYTWKVTYKDLDGFDYQAVGHINVLR